MDFLIKNWDSVLAVVLLVLFMLFLIKKGYTAKVARIALYLVAEAEDQYGGGTGELKFSAVTTWIYERLPLVIQILFTAKQIDNLIENAVIELKAYLKAREQEDIQIE